MKIIKKKGIVDRNERIVPVRNTVAIIQSGELLRPIINEG